MGNKLGKEVMMIESFKEIEEVGEEEEEEEDYLVMTEQFVYS